MPNENLKGKDRFAFEKDKRIKKKWTMDDIPSQG